MIRHLREARDRPEKLPRRVLHSAADTDCSLQQVGSPDIADKNEVAGECADGLFAARQIADEESQMLRSMAGSVRNSYTYVANVDSSSLAQRVSPLKRVRGITEFTAFPRQVHPGAGGLGELARSGKKVCVDVGFCHAGNAQPIGASRAGVDTD